MVIKYSSVGGLNKIKPQHEEIIRWLENNPEFSNSTVFLEFRVPSRKNRDVDFLIIQENSIFLLELKNKNYTKISVNDFWEYWDSKSGKTVVDKKFWSGVKENPYDQANHTSDDLKDWMQRNVRNFVDYSPLVKYIKSGNFKIYPAVYIPSSCSIHKEDIERYRWCKLCIGTKDLSKVLTRKWRDFDGLTFGSDEIEELAELLSISDHSFSRKGRDSQTLISIIQFMVENEPNWVHEDEIKEDVFASGEKTIREIRKALKKAQKINLIFLETESYSLNPLLPRILEKGYEVSDLYNIWEKVVRLSDFERNDPKIFQIFASDIILEINESSEENMDITKIYRPFPFELLLYRFPKLLSYKEKTIPEFARNEGLLWTDIEHKYYISFTTDEGEDLVLCIISELHTINQILIVGDSSSGKTSLVRIVGYELLQLQIPVFLLQASDLDFEFFETINKYCANRKTKNSELIVIIENIHASTAEQLNILKQLLDSDLKFHIILTSRQFEVKLTDENILKSFPSKDHKRINLNSQTQLKNRANSYIERILSQMFPSTNVVDLQKFRDHLVSEIKGAWPLLQIEIEILKASIQTNNSKRLIEDTKYHQQQFYNHLLAHIEKQIINLTQIQTLNIGKNKAREILLIFYFFVKLEIPIRVDLFQELCQLDNRQMYQLIKLWEESGQISTENDNFPSLHPVYAETVLETLLSINEWAQARSNVQMTLNHIPGKTMDTKIRYKLLELDPSLMEILRTEEFDLNSIDYNSLTLDDLVYYSLSLSLDDLTNFLYNYSYRGTTNSQKLCFLWDTLKLEKIKELIETSSSFYGSLHFLNVIYNSRWIKFSELLEALVPEFFLSHLENSPQEIHDFLYYLAEWNYSRHQEVEIKNILHQLMDTRPNSFYISSISPQGLAILNQLNPNKVLNLLLNNPESNIYRILTFLSNTEKETQTEKCLFIELLSLVLEDSGKTYDLDILDDFLRFLKPNMIQKYVKISDAFNRWDIKYLHAQLKSSFCHIVNSFYSNLVSLTHSKTSELIKLFTVEDIFRIWNNQDPSREYPPRLVHYIEHLQQLGWDFIPDFLNKFQVQELCDYILPPDDDQYEDTGLLKILVQLYWPQREIFINSFNFVNWAQRHQSFYYQLIIDILFNYEIPNQKAIMEVFFKNHFYETYYFTRSFEELIQYCNTRGWNWHEWVDLSHLQELAQENLHDAKRKIEFLIEQGWTIPKPFSKSIMAQEFQKEQTYLSKLSLIKKGSYLYEQGKKEEGLKIILSFLNQEEPELDPSVFNSLIYNLRHTFSTEDQKIITNLIQPSLFYYIENSTHPSHFFRKSLNFAQYMNEMGYTQIPEILVILYKQIQEQFITGFWEQVKSHNLLDSHKKRICELLWETEDYYYLMRLPALFTESIMPYADEIHRHLKEGMKDLFLWDLYFRVLSYQYSPDAKKLALLDKILAQMVTDFNDLEPFLQLLIKDKDKQRFVLKGVSKLSYSVKKSLLMHSHCSLILRFFTYPSNTRNSQEFSSSEYIPLLSLDEWEEKMENCDEQYRNLLILVVRESYPAFMHDYQGIEESLGLN